MSSQQLLLDISLALNSSKKKEKLNALEKLTDLLGQEGPVKTLHRNSKTEDNNITWDILFIRVHNAVLSLIDESSTKNRQMCDKHIQIAHDVITQVLQKACYQKYLWINPNIITSSVLAVFECNVRVKLLGSVYLNIFNKFIMSERRSWCMLKEEYWVGMKNICRNHFNSPPQGIHSVVLLQMLIEIIRFSSKTCQISHNFLDLFTFLKDLYATNKKYGSDFENILLHLTNTLCLQLAVEFRYRVCEFMEYVFDFIKNFHDKKNPDKTTLVYHFFLTTLNIHNPNGLWEKRIFYASNVRKWKSQIREIYFLCYGEIKSIWKNPNQREVDVDLLNLFVDVSHLVSECNNENSHDTGDSDVSYGEPGPSNKRKCSSETVHAHCSRAKLIKFDEISNNLLANLNSTEVWFWLKVLELFLVKYPVTLKHDYCQLVEFLYGLICEKKDCENTKVAIRCLRSLLELENSFAKESNLINIQWLYDMWNKISTELIRSLYIEACEEAHLLIRSLISHYKLQDIEPLVKLYCFGTLRPELENFKTLCTVCQHCLLPEVVINEKSFKGRQQNYEKVREQLLNWLLQGEERFPSKDLAKVFIALILKKFEEDIVISVPSDDVLISQININDFCEFITQSYLTVSFKKLKFVQDSNAVESPLEIRIESTVKKKLFDLLSIQYESVNDGLNNETLGFTEKLKALENCLWFVELVCHLLSHFECGNDDCDDCIFLTDILQSALSLCSTKGLYLLKEKFYDLTPFCKLYCSSFHLRVQRKIREPAFTNLDFLQYLFELYQDYSLNDEVSADAEFDDGLNSVSRFSQLIKNPKSILHCMSLNRKEKIIVNIVETLCHYITVPGSSESNCYQDILAVKIVKNLTESNDTKSNFYLQLVLRVTCCLAKHDGITVNVLNNCLDLMQTIFSSKASDFEIIITALQVLKDLTALAQKLPDEDTHLKYKKIIEQLRNVIVIRKQCGIKATCKFIELLAEISKLDLDEDWEPSDGSSYTVLEEIIKFLKHPYYEVRLMAARQVGLLFTYNKSSKGSTVDWQRKMFKNLFEVLRSDSERYLVKEKGCGFEFYQCVASSISLISWASVICLSAYWRKKALFHLIYLSFLKQFPSDDVEEIVKLICGELKIEKEKKYVLHNFSYLFYKWAKKGHQIQDFPFYLMGYKTVDDFTLNHFPVFINVYIELGQLDIIKTLSSKLNKPVNHILKQCHSQILAYVLPALSENVNSEVTKKVQQLKRFVDDSVGSKTSLQWLTEFLDKVIYNMIRNMYDPQYLLSLCKFQGNLKNDKNPVGYSAAQIVETLENLGTNEGKHLLGKIAVEVPSMIEKILKWLLESVMTAVIHEEKVFAFYKYIFFVEITGKATRKGSVYFSINFFIVRDVVYTLVAILRKTEDEILTNMACECFKKLGDSYLEEFSSVIGEFLPAITTALTPAVKRGNQKALEVLNFFIYENFSKLGSYIALFDIFPSEDVFDEINKQIQRTQVRSKNLKNTIKHFVSTGRSKNSGCRIESLKKLSKMLSDNKVELKEMYEELKLMKGFSEDCKNSILHQLICMLVELTSDENTLVRIEAAKCLGELGPSDLTTLVLRPENNFTVSKSSVPALYRLLKSAISILSDLLISENYEIKTASSKALYAVLSTKQGKEIFQDTKESCLENVVYLTPFVSKNCETLQVNIRTDVFLNKFGQHHLWRPDNHEKWIVSLLESLLRSLTDSRGVITAFIELIQVHWQFAENIFPVCLDFVLSFKEKKCSQMINKNISAFFEDHFHYSEKSPASVNKTSVQCILNVVDYIRMQRNHEGFHQGFDLNLNFLHVAKAALYCSAFFTSIFYAELWFEEKKKTHGLGYSYMDINMICELYPEEGFALAEILRKCHFEIGNLDGIHGCGYMHILNSRSEIQHYEHLRNWSLSMLHHDIQLSQGSVGSEIGLFHSLEQFGMCYTLNHLIKTHSETPELTAIQYKCAAKLLDWSQLDSTYKRKNNLTSDCFDKCYYFALKAFHDGDIATFKNESQKTKKIVLSELANCSLESSKNLYLFITELQCIKELDEFATTIRGSNVHELRELFEKWDRQDDIKCSEFKLVESILTNRTIMIRDTWEKEKNDELKNYLQTLLCRTYYKLTVASRKEKKYETAVRTLSYFNNMSNVPEDIAGKMKVEKARIMWDRGDREIATFLLSHFLKKNEISGELKLKSLRIYGDWMATTKSENSREIIENYYLKSIDQSNGSPNRIHSFASLAKFAYSIYEQFNEYLTSPLFEIKQNLISTQQDLASELRQELGWNRNVEKRKAYQIAAKQSAIDENEIKNSKAERDSYLTLAIKYYLLSLKEGEKYNLAVFRIISLWLSNPSNPDVIQQLQKLLHHIPTYKFLCLLPQLVPRMADVCLISDLIEKILQDHPHHTLPLLFAISNSYEDLKYNGSKTTISNPRVLAANSMIKKFECNKKLERLISEMRRFSSALIELANYNPPDKGRPGSPVNFPENLQIRRITNLTAVPVPSLHIPYNKNCTYDNIIGVREFELQYYLVGGINMPKRITCIGSDGIRRPLLVKGRDDLRQDAVMQQVFTIMNSLLYQNKETSKRKLVIRTYKVVPLSQRSGVIEWCENTQPLSLYLVGPDGKSGAHKKYFPDDSSAFDCRCMIRTVFAQPQVTNEEKLKVFLDACKQLHPVFHHFFIEKFPAAGVWFERRLAYIHSVATSSMIGYILGLGDRHVHNILIDNSTAEVIHIDLGIAFEQGKTLPTPETVPFRLTRDIVDGMGLSGVEGDFRISCIKAMEVLRENQDTILTLLQVLLYDPLYTWTITPEKAYFIQNHTETSSTTTEKSSPDLETNKMAERALIRLKQKLQGTEAGIGATTVEGQVRILINEARDPNNLCRLFHGWQAYL